MTADVPLRLGAQVVLRLDDSPPMPSHGDPFWVVHRDIFEGSGFGFRCMMCGRHGGALGTWWRACAEGHPYECPDVMCGRLFSTRQALASHLRSAKTGRHVTETPTR